MLIECYDFVTFLYFFRDFCIFFCLFSRLQNRAKMPTWKNRPISADFPHPWFRVPKMN
jgi:hypothetical protein